MDDDKCRAKHWRDHFTRSGFDVETTEGDTMLQAALQYWPDYVLVRDLALAETLHSNPYLTHVKVRHVG